MRLLMDNRMGIGIPTGGGQQRSGLLLAGNHLSISIRDGCHCFEYSGERVLVTFDPEPFAPGLLNDQCKKIFESIIEHYGYGRYCETELHQHITKL